MEKKVLVTWLDSLVEERYPQVRGALSKKFENGSKELVQGFCPLGVICELSQLGTWEVHNYSNKLSYLSCTNYLPKEVLEWAKISKKEYDTIMPFIFALNDGAKVSQKEIGLILRRKYVKYL